MSYPQTSRAVVVEDHDSGISVRELPVPALARNAVLVHVEAATGCGTDVHIAAGHMRHAATCRVPLVLGHEMVGRVVALGRDRTSDALNRQVSEGDLIAWASPWCGSCYWCAIAKQPTLCINANVYGFGPTNEFPGLTGGFAEYCYVHPRSQIVRVPDSLNPALASSATCAFRTVVHAFETAAGRITPTDTLVIQGSGAVGLYATAYAKIVGIPQVIVIGAPTERLNLATQWGATQVINIEATTPDERLEAVAAATDGRGADLVAECSGAAPAFTESLNLVRRGGRVLVVGAADPRPSQVHATSFNMRQISISGSISAEISHFWRAFDLLERHDKAFNFSALLGARYTLDTVDEALQSIANGSMKPVVEPSRS